MLQDAPRSDGAKQQASLQDSMFQVIRAAVQTFLSRRFGIITSSSKHQARCDVHVPWRVRGGA
jgi:hypothetical protein